METLMTAGGFVPIPFVLYAVLQSVRKHPQVNAFGILLAYAAVLIPVGVFTWGTIQQSLPPLLMMASAASAGIALLIGLVLLIGNLRTKPRKLNRSYGLLSLGVGVLIAVGLIAAPSILALIPNALPSTSGASAAAGFPADGFAPPATSADTSGSTTNTAITAPVGFSAPEGFAPPAGFAAAESTEDAAPTPTVELAPTSTPESARQAVLPTITPSPAVTSTPMPSLTPMATATPVLPTCELMVLYNLNFRVEPDAASALLLTIPYSTVITGYELSDGWWNVSYDGQTGWVSGDYVSALASCAALTAN